MAVPMNITKNRDSWFGQFLLCILEISLPLSRKYVLFWYGTYMFHENWNILFPIMGEKVLKTWTFSPPLPRKRIDKYMFHSSLIPSPILREIWVEWVISSSFPLFVMSYPPPIPHSRDLEKFEVALHIHRCVAINVFKKARLL